MPTAAQRIDDKPRGIAPPRSSSLKRLSPDSTAFDSPGHPTTVFIVLLGGCWIEHHRWCGFGSVLRFKLEVRRQAREA